MKFVIKVAKTGQNSEHAYICILQYKNLINIFFHKSAGELRIIIFKKKIRSMFV